VFLYFILFSAYNNMTNTLEEEISEESTLLASISQSHLTVTWRHLIQNNLEPKWSTQVNQEALLAEKWPEECIFVTLKAASTTTRRGKRSRAYPRKGVVKLSTDMKASKIKIGVHQLAAWKSIRRKSLVGEQASHWKCNNEACVNPSHITWENSTENTTRFCCKIHKDVGNYRCPHTPTCPGCISCYEIKKQD
jgi:hypothetical protein